MSTTPNLTLPYIEAAQAQKHVTHNDAIRALDCLVQLMVLTRILATPPVSPVEGARYIIAASPTGVWAGLAGKIAGFQDGAWAFFTAGEGWLAWVADEDVLVCWSGTAWISATAGSLNPAPLVGVNATADTTNRLAVSSAASLFNHAGTDHQIKINKAAAANAASQLFQTGFSGRAEIGLVGDDDLHFRVSTNGSTWADALVCKGATGTPRVPSFPKASLPAAGTAGAGATLYVTDEIGGAVLAFSDGTSWRRVTDRAVVS